MAVGKLASVAATVALVSILSVFYSPEELQWITHTTEEVQIVQPEFQDQIMEPEKINIQETTTIIIEKPPTEIKVQDVQEFEKEQIVVVSQNISEIETLVDSDYLWPVRQFQQQLMLAAEIIGIGFLMAWQISRRRNFKDISPAIS